LFVVQQVMQLARASDVVETDKGKQEEMHLE
jgi:hypothetical protein